MQDFIALRFANTLFEPIWNRNYVESIQITAAETLGVEERGGYYDNAGALRDMIQNHVMNLLALVAMEPPVSSHADDDPQRKVQGAFGNPPPTHWRRAVGLARGQYGPGHDRRDRGRGYQAKSTTCAGL